MKKGVVSVVAITLLVVILVSGAVSLNLVYNRMQSQTQTESQAAAQKLTGTLLSRIEVLADEYFIDIGDSRGAIVLDIKNVGGRTLDLNVDYISFKVENTLADVICRAESLAPGGAFETDVAKLTLAPNDMTRFNIFINTSLCSLKTATDYKYVITLPQGIYTSKIIYTIPSEGIVPGTVTLNCGDYVNEDTILAGDITGCVGTILHINASDITLDCNDHYLSNDGTGVGIINNGFNNVIIEECNINTNAGFGGSGAITLSNTEVNTIRNNNLTTYNGGIAFFNSNSAVIKNNKISAVCLTAINLEDSDNNIISENTLSNTMCVSALLNIEGDSDNNTLIDNTINAGGERGISLTLDGSDCPYNNTITGGSINGGVQDYYLECEDFTYFRNTDFTTNRTIYIDGSQLQDFRYNNDSSGGVWLSTALSSAAIISREIFSWTQDLIRWNDSVAGITIYYNLTDLNDGVEYNVYDNSNLIHTFLANNGKINFSVAFSGERNISVERTTATKPIITWAVPPTPADGATVDADNVYLNTTVTDLSNTSAFFDWNYSLVGYWSMDFTDASYVDDNSSYANHATYQGGLSVENITTGKYGDAIEFNGSTHYLNCGNDASLNISDIVTIEVWVYSKETRVSRIPISKGRWNNHGWYWWIDTSSWRLTYNEAGTATSASSGYTVPTNEWHHLVSIVDNVNLKIYWYVDGTLYDTDDMSYAFEADASENLYLGNYRSSGYEWRGILDEVKIYNRALSPEEINASYNNKAFQLKGNITNLVGGDYDYNAYAIDEQGNLRIIPYRDVTVTGKPNIIWVEPPTPGDGDTVNEDTVYLNATVIDLFNTSAFFDWNYSLVAYWSFEEGSGTTANDNSSNSNSGTLNNMDNLDWVLGEYGGALEFDGDNDYINMGDVDFDYNEFSVELWTKAVTNDNTSTNFPIHVTNLIGKGNWNDANNWYLGYRSSGTSPARYLSFIYGAAWAAGPTIHVNDFDLTEWHHIVGTANTTTQNIYMDGQLIDTHTLGHGSVSNTYNLQIARSSYTSRFYNGTIDEVRLYNRVLSPEEINASYNNKRFRLENNFTSLTAGTYYYNAYAIDEYGNLRITPYRDVTYTP